MKKIVILQHRLLHYRLGLFEQLRERCANRGIELHLVHGQPTRRELPKKDVGELPWAVRVTNKVWEIGARDVLWQPFPKNLRNADLVVVMQESRLLSNYPLLLSRLWFKRKLAYWGHGINFQSDAPTGLRERWKRFLLNRVDWWFAYTQMTTDILSKSGYPASQTTCLNNAIDTAAFKRDLAAVSDTALAEARAGLGIKAGARVGLFCGSLYPDKKLDFLVDACDRIYAQSPDFHCVVLGDGPSMQYMRDAATTRPWLHLLGVTKGAQKALYFRMADYMLNPGLVGLHVVDAFCAGLVMVTTSGARHSPEVCYLQDGINGVMTSDSTQDYAGRVLGLINSPTELAKLKATALADADVYTLERMVECFVDGIEQCLKSADFPNKTLVLKAPISATSFGAAQEQILNWGRAHESRYVVLANVHVVVTATQDAEFGRTVAAADMATPDGAPVAWMLRRLGNAQQERVSGPDLMWSLLERSGAAGVSVYLYGSTPETLSALIQRAAQQFPLLKIAGFESPPFRTLTAQEDEAVVKRINNSGAGLVFVGLGCPKQEHWMHAHRGRINAVMLGVGAAFDFHAGTVQRAPAWMRENGLEWLHRLTSEPKRLWKRYLVTNTAFILLAAYQLLRARIR